MRTTIKFQLSSHIKNHENLSFVFSYWSCLTHYLHYLVFADVSILPLMDFQTLSFLHFFGAFGESYNFYGRNMKNLLPTSNLQPGRVGFDAF